MLVHLLGATDEGADALSRAGKGAWADDRVLGVEFFRSTLPDDGVGSEGDVGSAGMGVHGVEEILSEVSLLAGLDGELPKVRTIGGDDGGSEDIDRIVVEHNRSIIGPCKGQERE